MTGASGPRTPIAWRHRDRWTWLHEARNSQPAKDRARRLKALQREYARLRERVRQLEAVIAAARRPRARRSE